jgi:O-antigen biosynthesis protein
MIQGPLETVGEAALLVPIVLEAIGPARVLDVGPRRGSLVTALRESGVEAVGADIASDGSLTGDEYDLVICRDLRLQLDERATRAVIAAVCRSTADVLVLARAQALDHAAAIDQPLPSFWVEAFGEHEFALDLDFWSGSATLLILRFRREKTDGELIDALLARRAGLHARLAAYYGRVRHQDDVIARLRFQLRSARDTLGWKILERLRRLRDWGVPADSHRRQAYSLAHRTLETFVDEGTAAVWSKIRHKIRRVAGGAGLGCAPAFDVAHDIDRQYEEWTQRHALTSGDMVRMRAAAEVFAYAPRVSIVLTAGNTDGRRLRGAIDSVRAQTYPYLELYVLVDDATTTEGVRQVLDDCAALDRRIRVTCLAAQAQRAAAGNTAIDMATGEFIGWLHADDELSADAIFEVVQRLNDCADLDVVYSDEDRLDADGRRVEPFFKPDWSPDLLLSCNYIHRLGVFRRRRLLEIGGFRVGLPGGEDYDLVLRLTERTGRIAHIPKVLYHGRKTSADVSTMPEAASWRRALADALRRRGTPGWVQDAPGSRSPIVRYRVVGTPLVSIIIPTRDHGELLQQCVSSIEERTAYPHYEIIVIDNGSVDPMTMKCLDAVGRRWEVHRYAAAFNFAAVSNFGAAKARGEYLLFLNDDTQVIRAEWLSAMLEHAQRPGVGAVGAKLLYPHGRIQHAGIVLGVGGVAGHALRHLPETALRPLRLADCVRNCAAVTAACMMVPRAVFGEVHGFDERFRVAYNDVDLCLRIRERGYLIVYSPLAALYHHESASRGRLHPPEDEALCLQRWGSVINAGDPYYNPNLTLKREDWSLRP